MRQIKKLSESTINRIAAGEVVERPASVIKELIENSVDAGAKNITVRIETAGKNLIVISDDGYGMSSDDMLLAIERHTTSKLQEDDITNIQFFGFRGEALPSIASVSNMQISSRKHGSEMGHIIKLSGGTLEESYAFDLPVGTKIEVRDLFFATPARLKFLKGDRTEQNACFDVVKRMSFAYPEVVFSFISDGKELFKVPTAAHHKDRLVDALGKEFIDNSSEILFERGGFSVKGHTTIPTYNRATSTEQFLFVNNRPVKDKMLNVAVKVAYQDYLSRDRHPVCVIFIETLPQYIDVNVHPAKTEVRFRDSNEVRGLLISAIRDALQRTSHNTSTVLADKIIQNNIPSFANDDRSQMRTSSYGFSARSSNYPNYSPTPKFQMPQMDISFLESRPVANSEEATESYIQDNIKHRLGAAVGQLHNTYIFSQVEDGIVIVDQHAAHERLVYEKIKTQLLNKQMPSQRLIIPVVVNLSDEYLAENLCDRTEELAKFGLNIQKFGTKAIAVREIPSLLGDFDIEKLIIDLADNFKDLGENIALQELIEHVTETYACHYSIRAGRSLSISEMNDLLREMEATPFSGQCNHGRPTYVQLSLSDIEKLFGRR